jgi:acyl-CoA reductase-like NAD-dependent aldehyde dehydrogenase
MVIDGEDVPAVGRDWFETCDPASGEVLARVPRAAAADVDAAVRAAREAQPGWQALSPRERGTMLLAIADLIADRAEELTRLETLDVGKPCTRRVSTSITPSASSASMARWRTSCRPRSSRSTAASPSPTASRTA